MMSKEILVHVSTPATRENDKLFRTLANAYTEFEPHQIHHGRFAREKVKADRLVRRRPKISSTRARISPTGEAASLSAPIASKDSYGSFPSSFSASERRLGQDELVRPISRLAQLDQSYLSWRKRATPKSSSKYSQTELRTSSDGADADTGFIEDSQSALQALQSQLQDIYSTTSADTSEDENDGGESSLHVESRSPLAPDTNSSHRDRLVEEPPLSSPSQGHVRVTRAPESSRGPKDLTTLIPQKSQNNQVRTNIGASISQEPTNLCNQATLADGGDRDAAQENLDFSHLLIDAFPPPPTISVACPGALPSQITKHLAAVKTKNPTRFRPLNIQRELEDDERGFWRVECMQWSLIAQRDFWLSLCENVCSGRMGWGITLHREHDSKHRLGLVQLYCWGEIVEHMWLLLWLCSKGKISGMGLKWIDVSGVAVVETE